MTDESLSRQAEALAQLVDPLTDRVIMIGDDDHVSLLLSSCSGVSVDVFEIDRRIVDSLNELAHLHGLPVKAREYDVRDPFPNPDDYTFFYINPPYSSKTRGLGIKVWTTRALEACSPLCRGVLVIPHADVATWSGQNVLEVQEFLTNNGCVIWAVSSDSQAYLNTSDPALLSTNFVIERVDPSRSAPVAPIDLTTRIYS